ncbi:hypothetical protein QA612_01890 [Evansella sp. AB-P1]|uniref:hypothetical protein n=1 Tax=Evansella sp. AB-P1 TaxID=3037653 RepID=UPI00241FB54C|nr:hypothetical protein [Evansella sp. AB-P1]MDG5786224.1 hypothetical protein [Evansella sp. AB-P1]
MNKSDLRVQFPLWNIALWIILMIWTYGVVYAVDMLLIDFKGVFENVNGVLIINWHVPEILSIYIGLLLSIIFFIAYFIRIKQHNKENPTNKLVGISFLKPSEFLEDDEMLRQVTEKATKNVYVMYSHGLPLIIFFLIVFDTSRYVYILLLFLLLIIHNALFYREIRKFLRG